MISNLLERTHHEVPLLFALSAVQIIVESRSINQEEATVLVDSCFKQWGELLKSAESMEKSTQVIQREVRKYKERGGNTKRGEKIQREVRKYKER